MKYTYEDIVNNAVKRLRENLEINIWLFDLEKSDKWEKPIIIIKLEMVMPGQQRQTKGTKVIGMSCEEELFYDGKRIRNSLPGIQRLVKPEMANRMNEEDFITLCFAAWFYKAYEAWRKK